MGRDPLQFGKATLGKEDRLSLESEFAYVRNTGKEFAGRLMLMVVSAVPCAACTSSRFGVICGRKFSKRAVDRNRARRLLRESFRLVKSKVKPCHILLIARRGIFGKCLHEVQKEMIYLMKKSEIWIQE